MFFCFSLVSEKKLNTKISDNNYGISHLDNEVKNEQWPNFQLTVTLRVFLDILCYKSNICHNHRDYRSSYCLFTEPSAPYIQINVSKTLRVVERTAVRLPCFATGSPKPSVKWWSDDRKGSLPCIIKFNGTCHDLACINFTCYWNVTVSRNMTYWCEAKNKYGVIGRNVSVEVLGDMSWFMCYNPTNIYLFKVNNRSTRKRYEICSKRQ